LGSARDALGSVRDAFGSVRDAFGSTGDAFRSARDAFGSARDAFGSAGDAFGSTGDAGDDQVSVPVALGPEPRMDRDRRAELLDDGGPRDHVSPPQLVPPHDPAVDPVLLEERPPPWLGGGG
jgi:hypothetical protein